MKILLTGYNGFVGEYVRALRSCEILADEKGQIFLYEKVRLDRCIKRIKPDAVIHLAAQSSVQVSFQNPTETYQINFLGTLNLLEALNNNGFCGRFLFVSSSEIYGHVEQLPIIESLQPHPRNPYAVSKIAGEALCYQWSQTTSMQIVIARAFNHIGYGQSENFVIASFAKKILEISANKKDPVIEIGDIDVTRDFTDVRDVVRAYFLLLDQGKNGEVYNICSGKEQSLRNLLNKMIELANIEVTLLQDKEKLRPNEQKRVCGSYEKMHEITGWKPEITLEQSLKDILQIRARNKYD